METLHWLLNIETFSKWNVFNIFKTISICNFRAFLNGTNAFDFFWDSCSSSFLWLILFLLARGLKNGAFFVFYYSNFVPWFSWEQSRTRIVVFDLPSQIVRVTKFMFLSYCPRSSWPIRIADSRKSNISEMSYKSSKLVDLGLTWLKMLKVMTRNNISRR